MTKVITDYGSKYETDGMLTKIELLNGETVSVPYLDEEVTISAEVPELYGTVDVRATARTYETLSAHLHNIAKVIREMGKNYTELSKILLKNLGLVDDYIKAGMNEMAKDKYPEFLNIVLNDLEARKKKMEEDMLANIEKAKENGATLLE
ncbi:MAG TPA: hypothetical protein PLW93_02280 [Candidatus Absconditabacterales bacterium]|nr:hypothetical protein [Candidatus Absconditabacterales bacterium]